MGDALRLANAVAELCAGSVDAFVARMNARAYELGMTGTHFVNANGLHDENHYTTAYDMALLSRYAMQNATFREIVGSETFEVPATNNNPARLLENANRLIHTREDRDNLEYAYATGIKTGDTAIVLSGKDKGKQGKVVTVSAKENKVIVEGVNMVTKHVKPKQAGQLGGRVQAEGALYASKVQLVCPKCDKLTRVAHKIEDGKKIRVCKHCGAELKY